MEQTTLASGVSNPFWQTEPLDPSWVISSRPSYGVDPLIRCTCPKIYNYEVAQQFTIKTIQFRIKIYAVHRVYVHGVL